MTDDIVTRLRENASHLRRIGYTADGDEIAEAADEIVRLQEWVNALRTDRDHWKEQSGQLYELIAKWDNEGKIQL